MKKVKFLGVLRLLLVLVGTGLRGAQPATQPSGTLPNYEQIRSAVEKHQEKITSELADILEEALEIIALSSNQQNELTEIHGLFKQLVGLDGELDWQKLWQQMQQSPMIGRAESPEISKLYDQLYAIKGPVYKNFYIAPDIIQKNESAKKLASLSIMSVGKYVLPGVGPTSIDALKKRAETEKTITINLDEIVKYFQDLKNYPIKNLEYIGFEITPDIIQKNESAKKLFSILTAGKLNLLREPQDLLQPEFIDSLKKMAETQKTITINLDEIVKFYQDIQNLEEQNNKKRQDIQAQIRQMQTQQLSPEMQKYEAITNQLSDKFENFMQQAAQENIADQFLKDINFWQNLFKKIVQKLGETIQEETATK